MRPPRRPLRAGTSWLLLLPLMIQSPLNAGHIPQRSRHGMVASGSEEASRAGVEMMQRGGNAVDAAVAVGFALAVTLPAAGNLGGGGFMLVRLRDGKTTFLDYRETAPAAARPDMYLDAHGQYIKDSSLVGYRAIGVPGSVAGMVEAQARFGKLSLRQVMAPAIRLAEEGFRVGAPLAQSLRESTALPQFPESRRIFLRDGRFFEMDERFRQPELARTLRRIARGGAEEFYHGSLARELAAALQKKGGLITEADLRSYDVKTREPLTGSYRGYQLITAPPPSSGGVALLEMLNILEVGDRERSDRRGRSGAEGDSGGGQAPRDYAAGGHHSASSIHWLAETMRRAFADRAEFLGDPDFAQVPVRGLISKSYAVERRRGIDPERATPSSSVRHGQPPKDESPETTHYSVVDREGNAVACTTTLNTSYGSGVTAEGLGFLMNNEMDDFAVAPGVPNTHGLIQGPANEIRPGKRPLSSMTPTIVTRDGRLFLIVGSPGGPRIITTVLQVITNLIDFKLNIQQAVDAPRFHHQWLPDRILMEEVGFSPDTIALLRQRGHTVEFDKLWSNAQAVLIDPATGDRLGGSDSRGAARAIGY